MKCIHKHPEGTSSVIFWRHHAICLRCMRRGYESIWRVLHIDSFEGLA